MLYLVISGGQTGVDQAALRAAKAVGLATAGFLPKGCRTLAGPRWDLVGDYGLVEHWSPDYAKRTEDNVRAAMATLRLAHDFESPGERCTLRAVRRHGKPWLDVPVPLTANTPAGVARWLRDRHVWVLNVAGNSEDTYPGIGEIVEPFLVEVFRLAIFP